MGPGAIWIQILKRPAMYLSRSTKITEVILSALMKKYHRYSTFFYIPWPTMVYHDISMVHKLYKYFDHGTFYLYHGWYRNLYHGIP